MIVAQGIDSRLELTKYAIALKAQNIDFVMRYYSHNSQKNLSLAEARALSDAGLQIGVIWETNGIQREFFTHEQGVADGAAAYQMARQVIGQPSGSAIYFAVDYDASDSDISSAISPYFSAIQQAFNLASLGRPAYSIGVYGSGLCCANLIQQGLAELSWLSQSTGFTGSKDYAAAQSYNLIQSPSADITVDDGVLLSVDRDASSGLCPTGLFTLG